MKARLGWTMRELDARLQVLEDALENGEIVVSTRLSDLLAPGLPDIAVGAQISEALEAVFREQETLLEHRMNARSQDPGSDRRAAEAQSSVELGSLTPSIRRALKSPATPPINGRLESASELRTEPLDVREAELLTQRIKNAMNQVCLLLAEAHDRRAWVVLGYSTWAQYVRQEFGYSRSRSYEILDQAKISRAVQTAAGATTMPDVSPYTARQIKPYLSEVVDEIHRRMATDSRAVPDEIIQNVLAHSRVTQISVAAGPTDGPPHPDGDHGHNGTEPLVDCGKLLAAVDYIARLPTPSVEFIAGTKMEPRQVESVRSAIGWLTRFAEAIERSIGPTQPRRKEVGLGLTAPIRH